MSKTYTELHVVQDVDTSIKYVHYICVDTVMDQNIMKELKKFTILVRMSSLEGKC